MKAELTAVPASCLASTKPGQPGCLNDADLNHTFSELAEAKINGDELELILDQGLPAGSSADPLCEAAGHGELVNEEVPPCLNSRIAST